MQQSKLNGLTETEYYRGLIAMFKKASFEHKFNVFEEAVLKIKNRFGKCESDINIVN